MVHFFCLQCPVEIHGVVYIYIYVRKLCFRSWAKQQASRQIVNVSNHTSKTSKGCHTWITKLAKECQRNVRICQNMSESLERAAAAASAAFHFCLLFLLCHGLLQCTNQLFVASGHCATMILRPTMASNTTMFFPIQHNATQRNTQLGTRKCISKITK